MSDVIINRNAAQIPNFAVNNDREEPAWLSRFLIAGMLACALCAYFLDRVSGGTERGTSVYVFGAIAVLLGSALVLSDSRAGISAFILCSCVSPRMNGNFRLEDLLIPAIMLVWMGRMARGDTFRIRTPITVPLILVAITMILSFLWGFAQDTNKNPTEGIFIMFKRIEYGLLFVFAFNSVRTLEDGRRLLLTFLGGAILLAIIGLSTAGADTRVGDTRATGLDMDNYNTFAGFLVIAASLAIAGAFQSRGKARVAYTLTAMLMISTLLKTYSREGYFMLAISVAALGILRYRQLLPIVLLTVIFSQFILPNTVIGRVNDAMEHLQNYQNERAGANSFTARIGGWTNRWTMVVAQPVFGNGPGAAPLKIDNEYLLRLIESGIVGLAAFLYLVFACGWHLVTCVLRLRRTESEAFAYGLLAAYISVVVQGNVSAAWSTIRTMEPFWILTGAIGGMLVHQNLMDKRADPNLAALDESYIV